MSTPIKVLLVEDNPTSRLIVRRMFEHLGCHVETAEDGQSALSRIATGGFQLVVLDQQLPLLDGYEVVERVRAGQWEKSIATVPILMLSGDEPDDDRLVWLSERRVSYRTKPVTLETLEAVLAGFRGREMKSN
jgi:CheY-like chemotaxis protein